MHNIRGRLERDKIAHRRDKSAHRRAPEDLAFKDISISLVGTMIRMSLIICTHQMSNQAKSCAKKLIQDSPRSINYFTPSSAES